jgi:hypothetical protein
VQAASLLPGDRVEQQFGGELSSRADITSTSFTNEYHRSDFRGDPRKMMELYYDAHLYFASWGSSRPATCAPSTWPG